jgi:hypothetical protein
MEFNSAFKALKLLKTPGNGRLNNLNDPVLNVLRFPVYVNAQSIIVYIQTFHYMTLDQPGISTDIVCGDQV